MRRVFILALAGTVVASATVPPQNKKTGAAVSGARTRRTAKSRARKPAPPSYQLHPDPERYTQIQKALAERGYFKGEANGEWKDDSTDALRRFQTDQKLTDDGKISALSLTALGLGARHDGTTARSVPVTPAPATADEPPPPASNY